MRHIALLSAALIVLISGPAVAGDKDKSAEPNDQSVKLSTLALPIVVEGRVVNYVFVTVKVDLTPSANAVSLRDKEPTFRDALVRDAYRTPFVVAGNYNKLDEARLKAVFIRDAATITGPGQVKGIEVLNQTPQHFIPPKQASPAVSH